MSSFFIRLRHLGLHRPRLLAAGLLGLAFWLALQPWALTLTTRSLLAWNAAVWPYLASMGWLMLRCVPARVRAIAEQEDASSAAVVGLVSAAAVLSLVAIVVELATHTGSGRGWAAALAAVTVLGSWLLLGVIYTFHYAHLFYEAPAGARPLRFPEGLTLPSYRDFLYFSFTIAVAAQTSDVTVVTTPMRSMVLTQSVLSFFFNLAIFGLSINIAAGQFGR